MFNIVSIIPGIDTGAPDLTERSRGFDPPNVLSIIPSVLVIFFLIFFFRETESDLVFK